MLKSLTPTLTGQIMRFHGIIGWAGVPVGTVVLALVLPIDADTGLQIAAGALEFGGLCMAVWGLEGTLKRVGHDPPLHRGWQRLRLLPKKLVERWKVRQGKTVPVSKSTTVPTEVLDGASGGDGVSEWQHPSEGSSLERRVNVVERNLEELRRAFKAFRERARNDSAAQRRRLEKERRERGRSDEQLSDLVEDLVAEGFEGEYLGLWWIALGIAVQTAAALLTAGV